MTTKETRRDDRKTRTVTEYRILIQRHGNAVKDWRARSLKAVERRIGLLTSPEPWRFYSGGYDAHKGPDDYACCAGTVYDECACGGLTMREAVAEKRKDLPPIESIRLQQRQIVTTAWEAMELPESDPALIQPPVGISVDRLRDKDRVDAKAAGTGRG